MNPVDAVAAFVAFARSGWGKLAGVLLLMLASGAAGYHAHKCAVVVTSTSAEKVTKEAEHTSREKGPTKATTSTRRIYAKCGEKPRLEEVDTTRVVETGPSLELTDKNLITLETRTSTQTVVPEQYKHFSVSAMFGVLNGGGLRLHAGYQVNDWLGVSAAVDPNFTEPKKTAVYVGPQIRF